MEIVRLPSTLPAPAELVKLNQRLHEGTISLDWQNVTSATPEQLTALLDGLNLADHYDLIGGEGIPATLIPAISAVMDQVKNDEPPQSSPPALPLSGDGPELWMPSEERDPLLSDEEDEPVEPAPVVSPPTNILSIPSHAELRDELETMVIRDLLGPAGGEDEELDEFRVHDRYLVGILASTRAPGLPAEEQDSQGIAEEGAEDSQSETEAAQTAGINTSSMGMSFCVDREAKALKITARWGHYGRIENPHAGRSMIWKRTQRENTRLLVLQEGQSERWQPEPEEQPDVYVKSIVRGSSNYWTVTLFLVNEQPTPKRWWDTAFLFQPELIVEAPDGGPIFRQRPSSTRRPYKIENQKLAILYRHQVGFAIGHGVSVHAETLNGDPTCAVRLSTSFIPRYEIPRTEAPTSDELPLLKGLCLDMRQLAESTPDQIPALLYPLVTAYSTWIDEQERRISDPQEDLGHYSQVAEKIVEQCRQTLERIEAGIMLLSTDPQAARAFTFMNQAMWQQRVHTLCAEASRRDRQTLSANEVSQITLEDFMQPAYHSWRPFQLAFILLNLPALTELHHPDRSEGPEALTDLLWFPTGGGKTEAYLGLTAYTLAIRRLQGVIEGRSGQDGVAVIMRYTLRLLTLQQFQRAAALICACELIRRADVATWGSTPFRLGLWVGQHSTPNTTKASHQAIDKAHSHSGYTAGYGNPRQLTHCPWCGTELVVTKDITVETYEEGRGRTLIFCSDRYGRCEFSRRQSSTEGLPVVVVDEEIYRLLPALLIATVDKFAQLPWRGEAQMLFGQVDKRCERHGFRSPALRDSDTHPKTSNQPRARSHPQSPLRPPDLIIQDELHLISGPLGSMVGLYETAVDKLASWQVGGRTVRPKVIAATATIRQAEQQVKSLFMRSLNIFPPQGLDIEDNFFSRQRSPSLETPGRVYLGICANGRRTKAVQIRVYLAFLAAAQRLFDTYGKAADPWMTLVGYFNSMSDLGSMRHLVDDDISNRIGRMQSRGLARRRRPRVQELTSRVSSDEIPGVLSDLERVFIPEPAQKDEASRPPRPIDVLLATNMISVGVDVKRLGLMVVAGQPKTTAEYIQATSRVGRSFPGLVCVIYNWMRPRDLSHYEQFEYYHATFYQQVEALSVTPFAPRALDRGLAALLTSLVRLSSTELSRNEDAGQVSASTPHFTPAIEAIVRRAEEVGSAEAGIDVKRNLDRLQAYWQEKASKEAHLGYAKADGGGGTTLLSHPRPGLWETFTCLDSLRNVEPSVRLLLSPRDLGHSSTDLESEEEQEANN